MEFYSLVCTKAEAALYKIRNFRIPKQKERLERLIGYADNIEELCKRAREGDEGAMEDLIGLVFNERET